MIPIFVNNHSMASRKKRAKVLDDNGNCVISTIFSSPIKASSDSQTDRTLSASIQFELNDANLVVNDVGVGHRHHALFSQTNAFKK